MKKVNIEKRIVLDQNLDELVELECLDKLETTALSNGLECSGVIEIKGNGIRKESVIPIKELIDVSIFAPFKKCSDSEQFSVHLSETHIDLLNDELLCQFTFDVTGLVDDNEENEENNDASLEDLLDDSEVVVQKVRYGLTYQSDTYGSIAKRYGVDEKALRMLNQNKAISGRMLILIP